MAAVTLDDVRKTFAGGTVAVAGISLEIQEGEFVTLLGPSGCGKTTTLRCIAGLETPDAGLIAVDGRTVFAKTGSVNKFVPPERRGLSMVFQSYALWPHMNVFDNVAFALRTKRMGRDEVAKKTENALRSVRLWDLRSRQISQLSGGQQQRIALARAIAPEPKVVLFDEPLSNIDAKLRESMRLQILELQRHMGLTAIYVTHDQDEAFSLSSRIVVMNEGRVEQIGSPAVVWSSPASAFVAGFVGSANSFVGVMSDKKTVVVGDSWQITLPSDSGYSVGDRVEVFIRSGDIRVQVNETLPSENNWKAQVDLQTFHGDYTTVILRIGDNQLTCRRSELLPADAEVVSIHVDPKSLLTYPAER